MTDLYQNIKEGIEGKPVSWYSEVFDLVFGPRLDRDRASHMWKEQLAKPKPSSEEKDKSDD